jgi:hypothetical protein
MKNFTKLPKMVLLSGTSLLMGFNATAKDTIPPVINLNTPDTVYIQIGGIYESKEPTVTDNQSDVASIKVYKTNGPEGTVTSFKRGWYSEIYEAIDSNGNSSSKTRHVLVDDLVKPEINLNTKETIYHPYRTPYTPVQPTVTDNYYPANQVSLTLVSSDVDPYVYGVYQDVYEAVDPSGNTARKTRTVIIGTGPTSVNDFSAQGLRFSPNPSNNSFELDIPSGNTLTLSVMSADGKLVLQKTLDASASIDTSIWPNGVYTLVMNDGKVSSASKLLIQH